MRAFAFSILIICGASPAAIASAASKTPAVDSSESRNIVLKHAPINSLKQLDDHLRALSKESPLSLLSDAARTRFVTGLRFGEQGLASYDYEPITSELTVSQAYRVLSLFGAQRTLSLLPDLRVSSPEDRNVLGSTDSALFQNPNPVIDDYPGYACAGRATCSESMHSICMSSC